MPRPGNYEVVFNSDSGYYGGGNLGDAGTLAAEPIPYMGRQWSVGLKLPPLAGVVLRLRP